MDWQKKGGMEWRGRCRAGWVRKGLGGLASDALIIDQLGEDKHAHWRHWWVTEMEAKV